MRTYSPSRSLGVLLAAGLALYIALFLDTAIGSFVRMPFGDGFDILKVEFAAQDAHDPGGYLWGPDNGHHIVWLRLLTTLDVRLFHGGSPIFMAATLLAIVSTAWMLSRAIWRGVEDRPLAWVLAAVPPLALLTSLNAFDVGVSINIPYVLTVAFAVAAFLRVEAPANGWGGLLTLLLLAAAAAMGNSVGLAAVPVLMIAIWRRAARGRLALFWLAGPALAAMFLATAGQIAVETTASPESPLLHLARMARYFLGFCGLPWSASSQRMSLPGGLDAAARLAGPAVGFVLAATGLVLAARPARGEGAPDRLDRTCCSLILFSLAAAAMASLGRVDASAGLQIPVRYSVLIAPLHIGVVVLLALRGRTRPRIEGRKALAGVACVLALALAHQVAGRHVILAYCGKINAALADFYAGRRTPEMAQYVHPNMVHAETVAAEIRRRRLYIR